MGGNLSPAWRRNAQQYNVTEKWKNAEIKKWMTHILARHPW
jgi:hypothetical protein